MGQKINPIGLRIAVSKAWKSRWFADKRTFGTLLNEDLTIRDLVKKRLDAAAVAEIIIERYANRVMKIPKEQKTNALSIERSSDFYTKFFNGSGVPPLPADGRNHGA